MGQIEDDSTGWGEVKFIDPPKRTGGEGGRQQLVLRSRTKVGVVKTIRYRCNPNCKLCGPIGGKNFQIYITGHEKSEGFAFRGEYMRKHET